VTKVDASRDSLDVHARQVFSVTIPTSAPSASTSHLAYVSFAIVRPTLDAGVRPYWPSSRRCSRP
jgi:hypothetical protein